MTRLWCPRWWSVRRRVADLERRVAALEAGWPRIVAWKPGLAARGRPGCGDATLGHTRLEYMAQR